MLVGVPLVRHGGCWIGGEMGYSRQLSLEAVNRSAIPSIPGAFLAVTQSQPVQPEMAMWIHSLAVLCCS